MKRILIILVTSILVLNLNSCTPIKDKQYASLQEMLDDAKASVKWIKAEDFKTILESGEKFYLIDCREQDEFNVACIKGATPVPRGVIEEKISDKAPKHKLPLYIYCSNGDRSALAAAILPYLKYSNVKVIEGGFDNWQTAYPELVENAPVRGAVSASPKKASGGCGG